MWYLLLDIYFVRRLTTPDLPLVIGTRASVYYYATEDSNGFSSAGVPNVNLIPSSNIQNDITVQKASYNPFVYEVSFTVSSAFNNAILQVSIVGIYYTKVFYFYCSIEDEDRSLNFTNVIGTCCIYRYSLMEHYSFI